MQFFTECKTKTEAKATYRKLSKCFHPDKNGENDLMIELKKQFDAWTPGAKVKDGLEEIISHFHTPFEINPRVELLERELIKLRKQLSNPTLERENSNLKLRILHLETWLENLKEERSKETNLRYDYACKIVMREKENEELRKLLNNNIAMIQEQNVEIENLQAQIAALPKQEQDLTLWEKVKYVIGDKSVKRYN